MDVDANAAFSGYPMSLNQANLDSAWTRLRRITRSWSNDFLSPTRFAKPGDPRQATKLRDLHCDLQQHSSEYTWQYIILTRPNFSYGYAQEMIGPPGFARTLFITEQIMESCSLHF
jgi:hypothetical protein